MMREKGGRVRVLSEGRKGGREDSDPNGIGLYRFMVNFDGRKFFD